MILNKSLLLYINHFDSINKNASNSVFIYTVKQNYSILLQLSKTKQWNYWLLQWSTVWHCFRVLNRPLFVTVTIEGEARKLNPAKQSLFQHAPSSLSLPKKTNSAFANLWLLLVCIKVYLNTSDVIQPHQGAQQY